jgi:phenylacetate-coenzyme A ligase PaaK-like adenylate-forming protein
VIALKVWIIGGEQQDEEDRQLFEDVVVVVVHKEKGLQEVGGSFVQDDMEQ